MVFCLLFYSVRSSFNLLSFQQSLWFLSSFVLFVFCFCVCLRLQRPLCVCSCLFRSPCCYFLFTLWSLPTCVSVSASPCALTIHTWSAVCPMIYVTLHLLSFFFGIFSWFLRSHNSYPLHFPHFLQFIFFIFLDSSLLCKCLVF